MRRPELTPKQKRKEVLIGLCATAAINAGMMCVPGWTWLVWISQFFYLIPAVIVLSILKRSHIVAAMLLVAGATFVLDIALCGYAASHGGGIIL